jgi:hypothetical protein
VVPSGGFKRILSFTTWRFVMSVAAVQERLVEVAAGECGRRAARAPAGEQKTFRS